MIDQSISDYKDAYEQLKLLIEDPIESFNESDNTKDNEYDELNNTRITLKRKIRNLKNFNKEYSEYKKSLNMKLDSLKPIEFVLDNQSELISDEITNMFINRMNFIILSPCAPMDLRHKKGSTSPNLV